MHYVSFPRGPELLVRDLVLTLWLGLGWLYFCGCVFRNNENRDEHPLFDNVFASEGAPHGRTYL